MADGTVHCCSPFASGEDNFYLLIRRCCHNLNPMVLELLAGVSAID
jgi:hypothetical protein